MSGILDYTKNIICNTDIYIFDATTKTGKFLGPSDLMNIHYLS